MMNTLLIISKIFLILFSLFIIYIENKREANKINNYFSILLFLYLIKDVGTYYLSLQFPNNITFFRSMYWIILLLNLLPILYFSVLIERYIIEDKKTKIIIYLYGTGFIITSLISQILGFRLLLLGIIILKSIEILFYIFLLIKLNSEYFEIDKNFLAKNFRTINLIFGLYILITLLSSFTTIVHILEIIIYFLYLTLTYGIIQDSYSKLEDKVAYLEKEIKTIIELLARVGNAMRSNKDLTETLNVVVDYSTEVLEAKAAALLLLSDDKKYLNVKVIKGLYPPPEKVEGYAATKEKFLIEKFKNLKIPVGETYLGEVAEKGEPLFITDARNNSKIIQSAKELMEIRTVIVIPLKVREEVIGVLSFLNKSTGGEFKEEDYHLARVLGEQSAITINNFKLYNSLLEQQKAERDIQIAGQIQKQLLPKQVPAFKGIELFGFSKPAKGVGGDYYDFLNFGYKVLGVIMADVAGKGVPAALVMVMIRTIIHTIARGNLSPDKVVTYVNKLLAGDITQERYATMFYLLIDEKSKKMYYTNAGHGPAIWFKSKEKKFDFLDTAGIPVGIDREQIYEAGISQLEKGDIVMLYTDGITEAMNMERDQFGINRVKNVIERYNDKSVDEIGAKLLESIERFVGDAPQHDDETFILIKMK